MSGATFDTGVLVALDRNERQAWALLRRSVNRGEVPTVPTVVSAQAWRDGRRQVQLGRAMGQCRAESLDEELARAAGELCGRARTSDIVDAVVVESASRRKDVIFTSDARELEHLVSYVGEAVAVVEL